MSNPVTGDLADSSSPGEMMPVKFVERLKVGFQVIVEAGQGFLLGGPMVQDGPVFDRFCDALYVMNEWIKSNQQATRLVRVGRVEPFEGMVSVLTREDSR